MFCSGRVVASGQCTCCCSQRLYNILNEVDDSQDLGFK